MSRGCFVVLEGVDGSGTTTQAALLGEALTRLGRAVEVTREPTDGPVGRLLRAALTKTLADEDGRLIALDPKAMALLFASDRVDHTARCVGPRMGQGAIVISDRYVLSSLLYQSETAAEGRAILPWLAGINGQVPHPALTIVLDVSAEVAAARRRARGGPEELFERAELQRRLVQGYARAEEYLPGQRVVHVDGERDRDAVALELLELVLSVAA